MSASLPVITRESLLLRCHHFVKMQVWPLRRKLDPEAWLSNFRDHEEQHALFLLNSFMYCPRVFVEEMLESAVASVSQHVVDFHESLRRAQPQWDTFVDEMLVIAVPGELPTPADSGNLFARIARQRLGVTDHRVVSPESALELLLTNARLPIVFVDDFVGTGQQFITMWQREFGTHSTVSFSRFIPRNPECRAFYCPVVVTEEGAQAIVDACPGVTICSAHRLTTRYSALHAKSVVWPKALLATAVGFLEECSRRAGIPDLDGAKGDWRGFHKLGLTIAFEDGVPDATLPIFAWSQNGWKPLIRFD